MKNQKTIYEVVLVRTLRKGTPHETLQVVCKDGPVFTINPQDYPYNRGLLTATGYKEIVVESFAGITTSIKIDQKPIYTLPESNISQNTKLKNQIRKCENQLTSLLKTAVATTTVQDDIAKLPDLLKERAQMLTLYLPDIKPWREKFALEVMLLKATAKLCKAKTGDICWQPLRTPQKEIGQALYEAGFPQEILLDPYIGEVQEMMVDYTLDCRMYRNLCSYDDLQASRIMKYADTYLPVSLTANLITSYWNKTHNNLKK